MKPADREVYDLIFDAAYVFVNSPETWMIEAGKLFFTLINEWEKGRLRNIVVMSAAYDMAVSFNEMLQRDLQTNLQEVMDEAAANREREDSEAPEEG